MMAVIIRLQNLPLSASALNIRSFFQGLKIPDGGVNIVGGEDGDAFIAFSTDDDARQAMHLNGQKINGVTIKLLLSSKQEMQKIISDAQSGTLKRAAPLPSTDIVNQNEKRSITYFNPESTSNRHDTDMPPSAKMRIIDHSVNQNYLNNISITNNNKENNLFAVPPRPSEFSYRIAKPIVAHVPVKEHSAYRYDTPEYSENALDNNLCPQIFDEKAMHISYNSCRESSIDERFDDCKDYYEQQLRKTLLPTPPINDVPQMQINDRLELQMDGRCDMETNQENEIRTNDIHDVKHEVSMNNRRDMSMDDWPQMQSNEWLQTQMNDMSQIRMNDRLQIRMNDRSQIRMDDRPQMQTNDRQQMQVSNRIQMQTNDRPQLRMNDRSQIQMDDRPQVLMNDRREMNDWPQMNDRPQINDIPQINDRPQMQTNGRQPIHGSDRRPLYMRDMSPLQYYDRTEMQRDVNEFPIYDRSELPMYDREGIPIFNNDRIQMHDEELPSRRHRGHDRLEVQPHFSREIPFYDEYEEPSLDERERPMFDRFDGSKYGKSDIVNRDRARKTNYDRKSKPIHDKSPMHDRPRMPMSERSAAPFLETPKLPKNDQMKMLRREAPEPLNNHHDYTARPPWLKESKVPYVAPSANCAVRLSLPPSIISEKTIIDLFRNIVIATKNGIKMEQDDEKRLTGYVYVLFANGTESAKGLKLNGKVFRGIIITIESISDEDFERVCVGSESGKSTDQKKIEERSPFYRDMCLEISNIPQDVTESELKDYLNISINNKKMHFLQLVGSSYCLLTANDEAMIESVLKFNGVNYRGSVIKVVAISKFQLQGLLSTKTRDVKRVTVAAQKPAEQIKSNLSCIKLENLSENMKAVDVKQMLMPIIVTLPNIIVNKTECIINLQNAANCAKVVKDLKGRAETTFVITPISNTDFQSIKTTYLTALGRKSVLNNDKRPFADATPKPHGNTSSTSVRIKNFPNTITIKEIKDMTKNFNCQPLSIRICYDKGRNLGEAVLTFKESSEAVDFKSEFHGMRFIKKELEVLLTENN